MLRIKAVVIVLIVSTLIVSCNGKKKNSGEMIGFLVEPQCESQVKEYMDNLNKLEEFESGMLRINYKYSVISSIKYFGYFKSDFLSKDELEGYVNGAMRNCRVNKKITFDTKSEKSTQEFVKFIIIKNKEEPASPMFINVNPGKIEVLTK